MAFSIMSTVALVLLIALVPIVGSHQAFAFGWYDSSWGGYGSGWPDYYGAGTDPSLGW
jgi:hypothetical protein